jgi:hypothetical protein
VFSGRGRLVQTQCQHRNRLCAARSGEVTTQRLWAAGDRDSINDPFFGFEGRCGGRFAWGGASGSDVAALITTKNNLNRRGGPCARCMRCRIGIRSARAGDCSPSGALRTSCRRSDPATGRRY